MQTHERTLKQNSILANGISSLGRSIMLLFAVSVCGYATADADGPDYWQVTGVAASSGVNLRLGPATAFRSISRIPGGATDLQNLGCTPAMNASEFQRLNSSEQQLLKKLSWCRVEWQGQLGWVSSSYLREGAGQNGSDNADADNSPTETRRRPGQN